MGLPDQYGHNFSWQKRDYFLPTCVGRVLIIFEFVYVSFSIEMHISLHPGNAAEFVIEIRQAGFKRIM